MHEFNESLAKMFTAPICPTCAMIFDAQQYDDVDDCAYCSTCGTRYRIPAEYRPLHPEDAPEHDFLDTPQSVALEQFRADATRLSDTALRETRGATYELFERRFTEACEPYIDDLDPALRHHAIAIARDLDYVDDPGAWAAGFGPGLCSFTGIEDHRCRCGRHP